MRISDWSSDVCSSDLSAFLGAVRILTNASISRSSSVAMTGRRPTNSGISPNLSRSSGSTDLSRSEEHTSELQSLMRISYAVFCLKKKKYTDKSTMHKIYTNQITQTNKPNRHIKNTTT